jgi:RecA-family ATPase
MIEVVVETLEEKVERIKKKLHYGNDASIVRGNTKWILEPLIPKKGITILDGLGGSGKTWLALNLSYAISLGQDFLGLFPVTTPGKVLYLTAEEDEETFAERLDMIQRHYPENKNFIWLSLLEEGVDITSYLCTRKRWDRVATETAQIIEKLIKEIKPILVILDPLISFFGLNENDSEDAMFFYSVLRHMIREYHVNFLVLHHQNKEGMKAEADDVISFRGSSVLREQARSRIVYKNIKISENVYAKKIILEKSNRHSNLKNSLPIYLKFEGGIHTYNKAFELEAKKAEEEAKQKGKKGKSKKGNEGIGGYEVDF